MSFPVFHSRSVINLLDLNIIFGILLDPSFLDGAINNLYCYAYATFAVCRLPLFYLLPSMQRSISFYC